MILTQNRISDVLTFLYDLSAFWLQTATSFPVDRIIQPDYNIKVAFDNRFSFILTEFYMKIDDILKKCIEIANSHFPRPAGPHFPASQGHIKRPVLEIGRAERVPPC